MRKTGIIIISRKRYSLLASCLESVLDNSSGNVKIYVGCDSDDPQTKEVAKKYGATVAVAKPSINRHQSLLSPICQHVDCDYIFNINDDVEIQTKDFDIVIQETIEEFLKDKPDRIVYGRCNESWPPKYAPIKKNMEEHQGFKYACYPIMTRETVKCLGFFMPEEISNSGADIELARVFNNLRGANIVPCQPRCLDIPIKIYDCVGNPGDSEKRSQEAGYWIWHGGHIMSALINLSKHIEGAVTPERQVTDSDYSYIFDQLPLPMRLPQEPEKSLPPQTPPIVHPFPSPL